MPAGASHGHAMGWQRAENLLVALGIIAVMIALGQPWWLLLVTFLVFDLSALGYAVSQRVGALSYNLVHNYAPPGALVVGWAALQLAAVDAGWLLVIAACWAFHVAVDRALGFGLKLGPFTHTHLGAIGKDAPSRRSAESS